MSVEIIADALQDIQRFFDALPEATLKAGMLAINDAADDSVPDIRRQMRKEVNFPRGYLEGGKRLYVKRRANTASLEAIIAGRDRPTSLARFVPAGATPENSRRRELSLQVKPGQVAKTRRAWLVNLRNGNTGLAIRLKEGEELRRSVGAVLLRGPSNKRPDANVYLLYGPSVDQVFRGVANDKTDEILRRALNNFVRQFGRLTGNG